MSRIKVIATRIFPDFMQMVCKSEWKLKLRIFTMPLPPYPQLLQKLKEIIKQHPELEPTLQPVIEYMQQTREAYMKMVLEKMEE